VEVSKSLRPGGSKDINVRRADESQDRRTTGEGAKDGGLVKVHLRHRPLASVSISRRVSGTSDPWICMPAAKG